MLGVHYQQLTQFAQVTPYSRDVRSSSKTMPMLHQLNEPNRVKIGSMLQMQAQRL